jgi:hypothetical protein
MSSKTAAEIGLGILNKRAANGPVRFKKQQR